MWSIKQNPQVQHTFRISCIWLVGSVIIPLGLIYFLIAYKQASFDHAVGQGSLLALAVGIAGAAVAIEMALENRGMLLGIYQLVLVLILLAAAMCYAGASQVSHHKVTTTLTNSQIRQSIFLLVLSIAFGIIAVTRQAWKSYIKGDT